MDFRLRVFVEVATHLSFTKAANALDISQPAISKHIQELEGAFNVKLFDRAGGKISLTSAGEMMLHHAEVILGKYKELGNDMLLLAALSNDGKHNICMPSQLRIAATLSSLQKFVAPMLEEFAANYPSVKITLTVASKDDVEELFRISAVDFVFTGPGIPGEDFLYSSSSPAFVLFVKQWCQKSNTPGQKSKESCSQ